MKRQLLVVAVSAALVALAAGCAGPQQPARTSRSCSPSRRQEDRLAGKEDGFRQREAGLDKRAASDDRDAAAAQLRDEERNGKSLAAEAAVVVGGTVAGQPLAMAPPSPPAPSTAAMPILEPRVAGDSNTEKYADHQDNRAPREGDAGVDVVDRRRHGFVQQRAPHAQ